MTSKNTALLNQIMVLLNKNHFSDCTYLDQKIQTAEALLKAYKTHLEDNDQSDEDPVESLKQTLREQNTILHQQTHLIETLVKILSQNQEKTNVSLTSL